MSKQQTGEEQSTLLMVLIVSVLILAVGQYMLYRNMQHIKSMIGVTTMELKEGKGIKKDAVIMNGNQLMIRVGGVEGEMTEDTELNDGTVVKIDGTIVRSDGSKSKMNDGDELLKDGTLMQK